MKKVDLMKFDNSDYQPGSILKRLAWFIFGRIFINTYLPFPMSIKILILRVFGTKIGSNVTIKPKVNIKYPWFLEIGSNVWIGECVWIDNLAKVSIESNVCISQDAMLLTGNHDYKSVSFDMVIKPIIIEEGAWVGAKSIVCPGVTMKTHSILAVNSVLSNTAESYMIYRGNPALAVRNREIRN